MGLAVNLEKLVPGADYSGALAEDTRNAWEAIVWRDQRPKPTWEEIQSVVILPSLEDRLNHLFNNLSASLRGQCYALKAGMREALFIGDVEGAKAIVAESSVSEELKTQFLAEFDAQV